MRPGIGFSIFVALSMGLHLLAWTTTTSSGVGSAGAGDSPISLMAISGDLSSVVQEWTLAAAMKKEKAVVTEAPDPETSVDRPMKQQAIAEKEPVPSDTKSVAPPASEPLPRKRAAVDNSSKTAPNNTKLAARQREPQRKSIASITEPKDRAENTRKAEIAAGEGKTATAGIGHSNVQTMSDANNDRLLAVWGGRIRMAIKKSMERTPTAHRAGAVQLRLALTTTGKLDKLELTTASGKQAIDRKVVQAVKRARFPRAPNDLTAGTYHFNLPLRFRR